MARSRMHPLILGPDRFGRSVVVAGDRLCFAGTGEVPQTPGARRLPCREARIEGPTWALLDHGDLDDLAPIVSRGVTGVVVTGVPERAAGAVATVVRAHEVRVVIVVEGGVGGDLDALRRNRDPLVRFARRSFDGGEELDHACGVPVFSEDESPVVQAQRAFGRRFELEPGAAGDLIVRDVATDAPLVRVVAGVLPESLEPPGKGPAS